MTELLNIHNLIVEYGQGRQVWPAVRHIDLHINAGETLALVGESGCGKSTLALALMGLLPKNQSRVHADSMTFEGKDLLGLSDENWRHIRGKRMAMVFQDPFSSLNPVLTIGYQLRETIELDGPLGQNQLQDQLKMVQLDDPERILGSYPHQISGGQRQRVMIAMALARNPSLLIADEPTTALDVTIQDDIIKLLIHLQKKLHMAMLFVTHNVALVSQVAKRTAVMYAGQIVETGETNAILKDPRHPYTQALLKSLPNLTPQFPLPVLEGQPPELSRIPAGCAFHPRCSRKFEPCNVEDPEERPSAQSRSRCHLYPL